MKALIDADSLLYKACCSVEEKVVWNENEVECGMEEEAVVVYTTDLQAIKQYFDDEIQRIVEATETTEAIVVLTDDNNFRYDNPLGYKENRKSIRRPEGLKELRDYVIHKHRTIIIPNLEADDYVVYMKTKYPNEYVLCAIDKDVLYQTEGVHYHYNDDIEIETTREESIYYAYYQCLVGDVSDGYKGCPGIGHVKATRILNECENEQEMWEATLKCFESKKLDEEYAINMMRLANMHQYNGEEIVLWKPRGK